MTETSSEKSVTLLVKLPGTDIHVIRKNSLKITSSSTSVDGSHDLLLALMNSREIINRHVTCMGTEPIRGARSGARSGATSAPADDARV